MNTNNALLELLGLTKNTRYIYIPEKHINVTVKKENNITVIKHCDQKLINLLLKQNNAECLEFCYGSLLDNALYACKKGCMSVYESYVNCWSSDYTVYFSRNYDVITDKFYTDFKEELQEYYNE